MCFVIWTTKHRPSTSTNQTKPNQTKKRLNIKDGSSAGAGGDGKISVSELVKLAEAAVAAEEAAEGGGGGGGSAAKEGGAAASALASASAAAAAKETAKTR